MKETKKNKRKKKKPSNNNNDSKQKNQERTTDEVFKVNEWVILITQFGEEWRCEACKELKTKKNDSVDRIGHVHLWPVTCCYCW